MAKKPRQRDDFRSAEAAVQFASAVRLHQAGQLREAEPLYRQVLAYDPQHVDALHLLGVLAHQAGHSAGAVELIGKALALDERVPEFHYNIGLAYGALGRFDEAATHNARAVALRPDYAEAHLNLGNARNAQGRHEEAVASYQRMLAIRPASPEAHYNVANALSALARTEEAIGHYRAALELRPDYAEAENNLGAALMAQGKAAAAAVHHERALKLNPELVAALVNLGNALRAQGYFDEAIQNYRVALARDPNHAQAHYNFGMALLALDEPAEALACFRRALELDPSLTGASLKLAKTALARGDLETALAAGKRLRDAGVSEGPSLLYACFLDPRAAPFAGAYRAELTRAIAQPWGNPRLLAGLAAEALKADPAIGPLLAGASPIGMAEIKALARNELLAAHLITVQVSDSNLERLLTAARRALLHLTHETEQTDLLAFSCALARQCFLNDYVFACTAEETRLIGFLGKASAAALHASANISPVQLAAFACYAPLHAIDDARALLARSWPEPVRALLDQQVSEPEQEARIRATLPRLPAIAVAQAGRAPHEENPYPRWTRSAAIVRPQPLEAYLRDRFPLAPIQPLGQSKLEYLIAGCGTGQQAAAAMQAFSGLKVTAIDPSFANLAYAKRMTDALGLREIGYAQADILELGGQRTFDVVDFAVPHHMADPLAGWRVLVGLLRPNGLMRIALSSKSAWQAVTAARNLITERGWRGTPEDIRAARQAICGLPDGAPAKSTTALSDFFALSSCRDLLFHAREHSLGIPAIAGFLGDNGLEFLGFEIAPHQARRYAERFPDDPAKTNLENWHAFEQDNPETSTYQFWVQKRATPAGAP